MIYTALGDSITYGDSASSKEKAYPQLAVSSLNTSSQNAGVRVLARPGWTSSDLLYAVMRQGSSYFRDSTDVSVWIGGVDLANAAIFAFQNGLPLNARQIEGEYRRNLNGILHHIKRSSRARIICFTQYNPFPNSPLAVEWIGRLNQMIHEIAQSYDARVVPAHKWFEGKQADLIYGYKRGVIEDALGGFYPIHPNDKGHRVIAKGLVPFLETQRR